MIKILLHFLALVTLITVSSNALVVTASAAPAGAGAPTTKTFDDCKKSFFGLVPWYQYLDREFVSLSAPEDASICDVNCFNFFNQTEANDCGQKDSDVPGVLLAVVDDLLRIAGVVAVAYVLVGAFKYVTSQGEAEKAAEAQSTISNALAGLAVAIFAIVFIRFLGSRLGG